MNIKLWYLYRDGANYKKHNSITFSNSNDLVIPFIVDQIQARLIDGEWLSAREWGLPDLHFSDFDEELDHNWHEFDCIEETNYSDVREDILDFLERIKTSSL